MYANRDISFFIDGDERHNCHPNASCANRKGGFTCRCRRGFAGNGVNCSGSVAFVDSEPSIINRHVLYALYGKSFVQLFLYFPTIFEEVFFVFSIMRFFCR